MKTWKAAAASFLALAGATLLVVSIVRAETAENPSERVANAVVAGDEGVPAAIYDGLTRAGWTFEESFNSFEWDAVNQKLLVHHHGPSEKLLAKLRAHLPPSSFELVHDAYPVAALEAEAKRLMASDASINGFPVVSAGPLPDGSGLQVFIEGASAISEVPKVPSNFSAYPVEVAFRQKPFPVAG